MDKAVSLLRSRAVIGILVFAALALPALPASGAKQKAHTAKFSVAIALLGPTNNTTVARYGASPTFDWKITMTGRPPARGSGRLEVSTSPTFSQSAVFRFDCGYSPGDCPTSYQWPNQTPFWYDQANSCSDVPPVGSQLREPLHDALLARPIRASGREVVLEPGGRAAALGADRHHPAQGQRSGRHLGLRQQRDRLLPRR